jgi:hypothetical protein
MHKIIALWLLVFVSTATIYGQSYSGTYTLQAPGGEVRLTLRQDTRGIVQGTLSSAAGALVVQGTADASGLTGLVTGPGTRLGFDAENRDALLQVRLFGFTVFGQPDYTRAQSLAFTRQGGAPGPAPRPEATAREVVINGARLSQERIETLERQYRTTIPAGRFWYDARCGAWGVEGGPTVGFLMAGLDLPGPMPAGISGGGTGIFINGREIHPQERMTLHQLLGAAYPGRYWLDARGNLGLEGGAVLVNLAAVAQRSGGGSRAGITSGMGGTVGVDGSGGVMFFDRTAGGGYQSYSN